jgi:simple sugar transport system permease protein
MTDTIGAKSRRRADTGGLSPAKFPSNRAPSSPEGGARAFLPWLIRRPELGAFVGMVLVYLVFAIVAGDKGFLTLDGTAAILNQCAELGIMAIPIALLMISGEFDLSVGSMLTTGSMVVAVTAGSFGWPIWLSIILAFAVGAIVGFLNGLIVVRTKLPSFIVTLASLFILQGVVLGASRLLTGLTQIPVTVDGSAEAVFATSVGGFNISIVWWIVLAVIGFWILERTVFGNWTFATGGDAVSARNAGVRTNVVKISLFMATALAATLVGVMQTAEFGSGNVLQGSNWEFKGIIAVVIGGVLLTGGYGSIVGAVLGTLTYGIADLGIFYTGWDTDWFDAFLGGLLLVAVLANNVLRRKAMVS